MIFDELTERKRALAVVGLGYVGLPLAVAFAKHFRVIGFDLNAEKIAAYKAGIDPTQEAGDEAVRCSGVEFTSDAAALQEAAFIIVAVPTPVNGDKTPDLEPIRSASALVGANMKKDTVVVFESTVYPGVTEDVCGPILAEKSGLQLGSEFFIGYSPERINPADPVHRLKNIVKIVSGMDEATLELVANVYSLIIEAGVHRAGSIKVAEAAKVAENSQRDINIAFMNELAMAFNRMGISTHKVVEAMNTKWNALGFRPGLVGGHCIGVDPYYFIYEAEKLGYHSQLIAAGRRINDGMSEFVARSVVREMIVEGIDVSRANVVLCGMTFKEDCIDTRNSRAVDVYNELAEMGLKLTAVDPVADREIFAKEYGIELTSLDDVKDADCLVFLVAHQQFRNLSAEQLKQLYKKTDGRKLLIDVKSMFDSSSLAQQDFRVWSL